MVSTFSTLGSMHVMPSTTLWWVRMAVHGQTAKTDYLYDLLVGEQSNGRIHK